MKRAKVFVSGLHAGDLEEIQKGKEYRFTYQKSYAGAPVSLTMPIKQQIYTFDSFPPFFEGLLPEGPMLNALVKRKKIDVEDYFEQLLQVGKEMVGNVTVVRVL